ncbi:hepatitis A virus cellular receptor 1 homolog [Psammomys obesus]|uniref:hepatitis A virus cellular receptor 1 homolog n=1 Tax=Psammomys obesus TaxID=48139 RepID=UPI002452F0B7|nr:hepatitis A virus cellular receptor 1 homolog [Psammomys obesus]
MMPSQVLISGLILLLPAAVDSFPQVHGVVGHPVTLPCTYPVSDGMSSMCWGRGECASDTCGQTLIRTDGHKIYYRTNNCYQLKSQLLQGNASLTIESVVESDSGVYCCGVETKGQDGVQSLNFSLQVQPDKKIMDLKETQNIRVFMFERWLFSVERLDIILTVSVRRDS